MKQIVLTICILFISFSNFAQDKKAIMGKWTYKDVYEKGSLGKEDLDMITMMFKEASLEFKETEVILSLMGKSEPAQWSFSDEDPKVINTVSKTGKKAALKIVKLDDKELVMEMGGTAFVFSKA